MDAPYPELAENLSKFTPEQIQVKLSAKTQELAQELTVKIREASRLKAALTEVNKKINELSFSRLPDLFHDQKITSLTTNGVKLNLTPYFKASISKKMEPTKREAALEYGREHFPELIKIKIVVEFGVDEYTEATKCFEVLKENNYGVQVEETVHHSSLTKWVEEKFLAGEEIEFDTINAKVGSYISIETEDKSISEALKRLRKNTNEDDNLGETDPDS